MIQLATPATPAVQLIPMHAIATDPQIRMRNGFDPISIGQLAASIQRLGLLQPIIVRPVDDGFVVVAGHRRFLAMQHAKFVDAPSLVTDASDEAMFERQLAENIQREQLTLADTADAVRTLHHIHGKPDKIASIVGKSKSWVSKHLSLTAPSFPALVRSLLDDGHTEDLELLLTMHQIKKADDSSRVFVKLLNEVRAGTAGRADARKVLEKLKAPSFDLDAPAEDDAADDDSEGTVGGGRVEVSFTLSPEQAEQFEALGAGRWVRAQLRSLARSA